MAAVVVVAQAGVFLLGLLQFVVVEGVGISELSLIDDFCLLQFLAAAAADFLLARGDDGLGFLQLSVAPAVAFAHLFAAGADRPLQSFPAAFFCLAALMAVPGPCQLQA